jgi:broad specificity phosphatase PhoE
VKVQKGWFDLLRHGETEGGQRYRGVTDDPLTDAGWEQMWRAVRGKGLWDRIVTSPLERCAAFAEALATRHAIVLEVDERWREIDFGAWEGHTVEELMAQDPQALQRFWHDPVAHPPPGGERLAAFRDRVLTAWLELVSRCRGERVLIVTHGGPIRVVLSHLAGRSLADVVAISVPLGHRVRWQPEVSGEFSGLPRRGSF